MAKLNLYKIDKNKKDDFLENLKNKLNYINEKIMKNAKNETYIMKLYNFFPREESKLLSWNWLLNEFEETTFRYKPQPRAIVMIEKEEEIYVITFGSSYFLVDKFCNRKFAFEFAKRSEYINIKTTALSAPSLQRNKVINSYSKCSNLMYDSGESFSKIKANMKIEEKETRFNGTIEIGTSIRFSMKENTLENIISIIDYVEETLKKDIIHNIPLFLEVDKIRTEELDSRLIKNIKEGNTEVKISEFDIVGVNEVFFHNDYGSIISFEGNNEFVEELNCKNVEAFIKKYKITDENILKIKVKMCNDAIENGDTRSLKDIIDFTDDLEKVVISNGIWYEYNDDYLKYLKESLSEIEVEYDFKYDKFDDTYLKYINDLYESDKGNNEFSTSNEQKIKKKIKDKYYKERVFNILREENDGFENYDRKLGKIDETKYELMDLYKDRTMYAVKIGNSSSKLCYVIDQSINGMKMLKSQKIDKDIDRIAIWIILDRKKKLKSKNNHIDLNSLNMLMLKNRIDSWKKEVRLAGYKPIVRINYSK